MTQSVWTRKLQRYCEWHLTLAGRSSSWPSAIARAEMRRTLELAAKGSVVLTTHGEPAAAVVPFTTLEDMRRALLHLLVAEIETTFTRSQERLKSRSGEVPLSSGEEMEGQFEKHCAERDDRTVGLAVRCHASEHAAPTSNQS